MSADEHANAATAHSLNYALGNLGGRQKSWMVDAAHPVPADFTTAPLPFAVRQRGRRRKLPRKPASNSTSPQLANVVAPLDTAHHAASAVTVFPSPTPSEEAWHRVPTPTTHDAEHAAPAHPDYLELGAAYANYAPATPLETVFMDAVQQSAPAPNADAQTRQEQPATLAATAATAAYAPQLSDFYAMPTLSPISRSPSRGQSNAQLASPQLPWSAQLRDAMIGQAPYTAPPAPRPQNVAPPHPLAYMNNWYTVDDCLQALKRFQDSYTVLLSHPRDRMRLSVLEEAVQNQDWPYLTLHQYYCMLTYNPRALPARLLTHEHLPQSVGVMQKVLDTNDTLSTAVLAFFANFPYPMAEIAQTWPTQLQHQAYLFQSFMVHSPNHNHLKLICEQRRYPPIARELAFELKIASPTFQSLTFTAFLRSIWRASPRTKRQAQLEAQAVALFKQTQVQYSQREALLAAKLEPLTREKYAREKDRELLFWGPRFSKIVTEFESTLAQHTTLPQQTQPPLHAEPRHPPSLPAPPPEMAPHSIRRVDPRTAQAAIQQTRGRERPRSQLVPTSRVVPAQPSIQSQPPVPLLPPVGWIQPQQRLPNPARFGLHQAHLRSPELQAQAIPSPFYLYTIGCVLSPVRLATAGRAIERFTFTLTPSDMQMIPKALPSETGGPDIRSVNAQSKILRLRCIKWPSAEPLSEHMWAVADTAWVPYSYITFNGKSLQQRKKVYNGKDLPIDLTGLLREGENLLEIAVVAQSHDTSYQNYLIAVEVLGIRTHQAIKQYCLTHGHVSAEEVVAGIKKKLSGPGDDDEISVVESSLTINLFDPFSASKMCDIPVRSTACLHNDCFDLETFLQTRRRKGDTSVADQWRCPICNADARPCELFVDGFIQDVRKRLEAQGLAHTRAIIMLQDGSWKPKAEVRDPNGVSDDPVSPTPSVMARPRSIPTHAEVIDLSD